MMKQKKPKLTLNEKYPPSEACSCDVCRSYCRRPGWWSVDEATKAIEAGYASRMMLEVSPERNFGVLSPAFNGAELNFALQQFAPNGCNFMKDGLCELHNTGVQPIECRFCHHERKGLGEVCHTDLEKDWNSSKGEQLIQKWFTLTGFSGAAYFKQIVKYKPKHRGR